MMREQTRRAGGCVVVVAAIAGGALASPPPDYGFDFVTIGARGNAGYGGGPDGQLAGRGAVNYDFRIARTEITGDKWLEFINTFAAIGDPHNFALERVGLPMITDTSYGGPGRRFRWAPGVENPETLTVRVLDWRVAARYCNWLHNDKAPTLEAVESGAYDASTFHAVPGGLADNVDRLPGARYFLPTLDEWMKAVHYDPNRYAPGEGGWWEHANMSDDPSLPGPPGIGDTDAGYTGPGYPDDYLRVGQYPDSFSPWGLLDTSGGVSEWLEGRPEQLPPGVPIQQGSYLNDGAPFGMPDFAPLDAAWITAAGLLGPTGFRVASIVPAPGGALLVVAFTVRFSKRSRER